MLERELYSDSQIAKNEFNKKMTHGEMSYKKYFPKNKLIVERSKNYWLDSIIRVFE